ncbi:ribosome assembly factor SBDS [Candidatus Woesearchaeota archaeon]|nr:ribosome assembly factor SBDS [Candidatus Woesearchaeota archaeon]
MVSIDKAVVARLKRNGKNFEILVDCEKALEFRKGKNISLYDILASDIIYKDNRKGERVSESDLMAVFKTTDVYEVVKIILKDGEIQIKKEIRDQERGEKLKKIINLIHRNCVDSKTGLPHPQQRIESAIEEAKARVDENKSAEEQVDQIVDKLRVIIPIKFETKRIELIIPAKYSGASFRVLKNYGKLLKSEWRNDGGLDVVIEIPAGIIDEFFSQINGICHGEVGSKILS